MGEPSVVVRDLTVVRGRRTVLDDVSLSVRPGQVTGLIGPSGSGKTTLMRCLVGVQVIVSGAVTVLGLPAGSAALRHRVAYMTQAASVYPDITVGENIAYFAALTGAPADRVPAVIEEVGLGPATKQLAARLSGGQLARVSLACALVADPEVLILDEPTVGLDPVLREDLWAGFGRRAAAGATVLVSSHVMNEAGRCDELILLREGQVLAYAAPAELLDRTGTDDLDAAFLALVRAGSGSEGRTA